MALVHPVRKRQRVWLWRADLFPTRSDDRQPVPVEVGMLE
jgi:hypothetical protein